MQTTWMVCELSSVFVPETVKGSVWWLTVNLALIYRQIHLKLLTDEHLRKQTLTEQSLLLAFLYN